MRFGIEKSLGAVVQDVQVATDPWDAGMEFGLHLYGSKRHRAYAKRSLREDPVMKRTLAKLAIRGAKEALTRVEKPVAGPGPDGVIDIGPPPTEDQRIAKAQEEAAEQYQVAFIESLTEGLESEKVDVFAFSDRATRDRDELIELLDWWKVVDEDGKEVKLTKANAAELFDCDTVVAEGRPYAGKTIGEALVEHLKAFLIGASNHRAKALGDADAKSDASSASA